MFVRPVSSQDFAAIPQLVEATFGRHDEGLLVQEMRTDGCIAIEYVATDRDVLIGHIALSRLVSPVGCLALAPLSVHPERQGKGIGSALIAKAMDRAEEEEWTAVFVLGNPKYYSRFGFDVEAAEDFETVYPSEFMAAHVFDPPEFGSLQRELIYPSAF
jgi:putative acetyltransferase